VDGRHANPIALSLHPSVAAVCGRRTIISQLMGRS
jgi:hypothetical protein